MPVERSPCNHVLRCLAAPPPFRRRHPNGVTATRLPGDPFQTSRWRSRPPSMAAFTARRHHSVHPERHLVHRGRQCHGDDGRRYRSPLCQGESKPGDLPHRITHKAGLQVLVAEIPRLGNALCTSRPRRRPDLLRLPPGIVDGSHHCGPRPIGTSRAGRTISACARIGSSDGGWLFRSCR